MDHVPRALWFIENRFDQALSLGEVATAAGLSRYRLARAFRGVMGRSVMAYVRGRRLTEAARRLAGGAPDILQVALAAGYGSHEAFTRAFRDQFGVTPEQVRAQRNLDNLTLVEPKLMDGTPHGDLEAPRIIQSPSLQVAGLSRSFTLQEADGIPVLWQQFQPFIETLSGGARTPAYGICTSEPGDRERFAYMAGIEVPEGADLPPELTRLRLPAATYAAFPHRGHLSTIRTTVHAAWSEWLPASGWRHAGHPDVIEWYGPAFDPATNSGGMEVWIPVMR